MSFVSLTPNAESLLREIMTVCQQHGSMAADYWVNRFDKLSFEEDALLRSTFKELSDANMIEARWASNIPYMLTVLNNGAAYFEMKAQKEKDSKKEKRSGIMRDIILLLIGALFGGLVEFLLFKLFGIGG